MPITEVQKLRPLRSRGVIPREVMQASFRWLHSIETIDNLPLATLAQQLDEFLLLDATIRENHDGV